MLAKFNRCRSCGVPIVAITTADQCGTVAALAAAADGPCVAWDLARGARAANDAGAAALPSEAADPFGGPPDPGAFLSGPAAALPDGSILIMLDADRYIPAPRPAAAVLALRDGYKARGMSLVLLGSAWTLPASLAPHVETIAEPLPDDAARAAILRQLHTDAGAPMPDDATLARHVAGTRGLPAFSVEQAAALAMSPAGLDPAILRDRWRAAVNATRGLQVDDTPGALDDLQGLEEAGTEIRAALRQAFADLVDHMAERLTPGPDGKPRVFRDTLVSNLAEFLETFAARNLTGDAELARLVEQARETLNGHDAESLRREPLTRATVAARIAGVKAQLDGMIVTRGRRFNFGAAAAAADAAADAAYAAAAGQKEHEAQMKRLIAYCEGKVRR